jgi:hypothetical protein
MKQLPVPVLLLFVVIAACSKQDANPDPAIEPATLSLNANEALPGDALLVKPGKPITTAEMNIVLNGVTVRGYASGDTAYVFMVPVIAPGTVSLSIPDLPQSNTVSLTIKNYERIADPQLIINEYVEKRNRSIDSVTKVVDGSNFQPSPASIVLLNQVKEEWNLQINGLSASDKELLAYVLKRNMPDPSQYSFEELPAGYFAKPGDLKGDVGDKLVAIAKNYVTAELICLSTIPFLLPTGIAFVAAPNPISALVFLGVFTTFIVSREVAIRRAEEVGSLKGVAEAVTETDAQRMAEFSNNTEKSLSMSVGFRNLSSADANIQPDINAAFTTERTFVNKDKEVEAVYNKATAKTTKLKGAYPSYASIIGNKTNGNITLPVEGKNIMIKGVSDPRISFTSTLSGTTKKVKITSTATTEINFNLQLAYKRTLDGKEFTKEISCLFKPEFDSTELYKISSVGKYRVNNYKGNGPNSELYCELKSGGQVVYTIYNDPSWADGTTFGASWSIARQNGRYYHSQSGFWHYGFPNIVVESPLTYPVSSFNYHNGTTYSK